MSTVPISFISPTYTTADFPNPTLDDKVEIFRDRVDGWQIAIAEELLRQITNAQPAAPMKHAGYCLISITFSYFEMIGQCLGGVTNPTNDFIRGFRAVYPTTTFPNSDIQILYDRIRCGMFHNGYTKRGVFINGTYSPTFSFDSDKTVLLNPHALVLDIRQHFTGVIVMLLDSTHTTERTHFENLFDRPPIR